jgi:molecular chaperone HtpG
VVALYWLKENNTDMTDQATSSPGETLGFQAEVKQLLHLMIHSLYSNREIFLRELISNASDACDRLRFAAIADESLLADDPELRIRVELDEAAGTLSVTDNGIGMSRDQVVEQLGTIAKSGTGEFLKSLEGTEAKDAGLIGQFGVGFYSAFIVADRVEVFTRQAGAPAQAGVRWSSDGQGEFTVAETNRAERGTTVRLHLRDDAREFADDFRLRGLIRKYSDHIAFPVLMPGKAGDEDGDAAEADTTVNTAKALWTRPRTEISEDEYREFYKHVSHDVQEPLTWSHNRVEGKREYTSLLYLPASAPFDLWNRESPRGLKLYVQRVFIMDEADQFLPLYLRFVRGVVDSGDLSLNVSRELLQQDETVAAIRSALTRRVLDMLAKLAADEQEKYRDFWKEFGRVLKEGPAEDPENRDKIAALLRFASTQGDGEEQSVSFADYLARKQEGQDKIYYLTADGYAAASSSPHLEAFRERGIEVLLLTDPVDEWMVNYLGEYDGLPLRDIRRGELDLAGPDSDDSDTEADPEEHRALLERLRERLGERVSAVRATSRLTESAACLALGEFDVGEQMRRLLEASGQAVPDSKPVLEINAEHPLVQRLGAEADDVRFGDLADLLLDQARLADGRALDDPGVFVQRLNRLLLDLAGEAGESA